MSEEKAPEMIWLDLPSGVAALDGSVLKKHIPYRRADLIDANLERLEKLAKEYTEAARVWQDAYAGASAERDTALAEVERLRDALVDIGEYWTRDGNLSSTLDSCWHAVEVAEAALDGVEE